MLPVCNKDVDKMGCKKGTVTVRVNNEKKKHLVERLPACKETKRSEASECGGGGVCEYGIVPQITKRWAVRQCCAKAKSQDETLEGLERGTERH